MKGDGVLGVAGVGAGPADLEQDGRVGRAGVEEETGEDETVDVGGEHGGGAGDGLEGGEAEAEDDGAWMGDAEGFSEGVEAGGEEEVLAASELRVEGGGGVSLGVGDVEASEGEDASEFLCCGTFF